MLVYFALGDASFSCFYPTPNLKFALPPTPIPDASQWNIGGVGSWRWVFALGMYISYFPIRIISYGWEMHLCETDIQVCVNKTC